MRVVPVPAAQVAGVWDHVEHWLANACRRTGMQQNPQGLRERCEEGRGTVLVVLEEDDALWGAAVIERDGEWCHITSLGADGFLNYFEELLPVWRSIAEATGCRGVSLRGRKGWDRVLAPFGFKRNGEFLEA